MNTLRLSVLASTMLCAAQAAAAPRVLTLEAALRQALLEAPGMIAARENRVAQRARVEGARAGYLPSVGYQFNWIRRTANCVNQPASFPCRIIETTPAPYETFNFFTAGVTIVQPIYDFGRTGGALDAAEVGLDAARSQVAAQRQALALEVKVAYYGVLIQQELVVVAEDALRQQRKHLEQAEGFYKVGTRTRIDVAQALADVANTELALLRSRTSLRTAKVVLLATIGAPSADLDFEVVRSQMPPLPEEVMGAEEVADLAVAQRADLRALDWAARQQEANLRTAQAGYWPQISLQFGPSFAGTEFHNLTTNFIATLTLSAPFGGAWNPYLTYHQVAEVRAAARAARAGATKLRNDVRVEVLSARLALAAAKEAVGAAERALVAARERHELAEGRYQTGAGNIIELSDAQAALTAARGARVQAEYDVSLSRARLLRALGRE
jgi:outer membrane protein TolC